MSKRIHEIVKHGDDVQKLTAAIGRAIDPTDIEDALQDLGLDVQVDTVDWGSEYGTITIEGGENETGIILTLKLVKVEQDFDTLNIVPSEEDEDE
jgi:hypothetical protein